MRERERNETVGEEEIHANLGNEESGVGFLEFEGWT
jgi:hypothetical protein